MAPRMQARMAVRDAMRLVIWSAIGVAATTLVGCGGGSTWRAVPGESLAQPQQAQRVRAEQARDALGKQLLGELTAALAQIPANAITVCKERAPAIAAEVAKANSLRIGRTSAKLRNPLNETPAWAADHVAKGEAQPAWFVGPNGELGALYPIVTMPVCVQCHGKVEALAPEVHDALRANYPRDRATGFAAGDLRGWFWVEVGS